MTLSLEGISLVWMVTILFRNIMLPVVSNEASTDIILDY